MSTSLPEPPVSVDAPPSMGHEPGVRLHLFALAALVLFLGVLTAGGHLYSPDEEIMFRTARSLWTQGNLAIEPIVVSADGDGFASRRGLDGKDYAQYGLGNSLFAGPLVWLGEFAAWIIPEESARKWLMFETTSYLPESEQPGVALIRRFVVSFQGTWILAVTALVLFLIVLRMTGGPRPGVGIDPSQNEDSTSGAGHLSPVVAAWAVSLSYVLGTMAWPHARTFFSEPLAGLGILLAFYGASYGRITPQRCLAVGAGLGLALLTRLDSSVMAPGVGLTLLLRWSAQVSGDGAPGVGGWFQRVIWTNAFGLRLLMVLAGPLSVGLWQLGFNWTHFGGPFESAYADQTEGINFSTPLFAGLHGFLGSPGKSLFLFSPILVLALAGWRRFQLHHQALAVGLLVAVIGKVWLHATWQNWAGGWCWGPRHIMQIHALLVPGVWGFVMVWGLWRRLILVGFLTVGTFVQLFGASQSFIDYYILYFRTPTTQPQARALYSPAEDAAAFGLYQVTAQHPESGRLVNVPLNALAAPLSDSIYVPQNTQWYRYWEMARLGYTDNVWLRLIRRSQGSERPVQ